MRNKTCGECRHFDEGTNMCCRFDDHLAEAYADADVCEYFECGLCVKQNGKNDTQSSLRESDDTQEVAG